MHESSFVSVGRSWKASAASALALLLSALLGACGGSGGEGSQAGIPGVESLKSNGDFFIVDYNGQGQNADLSIDGDVTNDTSFGRFAIPPGVFWGRLVDVHELDASVPPQRVSDPVYEDFVIEPDLVTQSDPARYLLDRDPITQKERLTIRFQKRGVDPLGFPVVTENFDQALADACDALPAVAIKNDDGSSSPPFTNLPRNACLVLRFEDCLKDDSQAALNLANTVKVFSGYPPVTPFSARVVFDPNHGASLRSGFHSTRVLVDMTTSVAESGGGVLAVNALGLPASLTNSTATNVSVRVPSRVDPGLGQFEVLTNLSGSPLDALDNRPVDFNSTTLDVVRAVRSGNSDEANNGFLRDTDRPRVIGAWPITTTSLAVDPAGEAGLDFLLAFTFQNICKKAPAIGDVVKVTLPPDQVHFLQVTAAGLLAGSAVSMLEVRAAKPVDDPLTLEGRDGLFEAPFDPALVDDPANDPLDLIPGCFVSFTEADFQPPTFLPFVGKVSTTAQIAIRFSEPMDPASLSPFGDFLIVNGAAPATRVSSADSQNIIAGEVLVNSDLTVFSHTPSSPFPHAFLAADPLHVELELARDLAGNRIQHLLPFVDFRINELDDPERNDSLVLRFNVDDNDEYEPNGDPGALGDGREDLRGQFFFDTTRGSIQPRPVSLTSWPIDRTNFVPSAMFQFASGVFTPLTPLGAKLQTVWRYCDAGWHVQDETKYNLDVIGLNWSPIGGLVVADFFNQLEIRLGHSRFLPDEPCCDPIFLGGTSGLPGPPSFFEDNYLAGSNPKVVHVRSLGYTVNPANLFNSTTGTPMIPFPLNRGLAPISTYTWRDTAILTLGADGDPRQVGIPLDTELGTPNYPPNIAGAGEVPSFGLPLLIEIKCYPSDRGLGLNRFDVSLANFGLITPGFRAYSAGGINTFGNPVQVLPDSELFPKGDINQAGIPPVPADNVFYIGQLDTVVRVSRVHTVWLDAGLSVDPLWQVPLLEPSPANQPAGTGVLLDFRSASGFTGGDAGTAPFDATKLDPYGDPDGLAILTGGDFAPLELTPLDDWSSNITVGNLSRYLQVRLTFVNNITTGVSAELTALALPYDLQ